MVRLGGSNVVLLDPKNYRSFRLLLGMVDVCIRKYVRLGLFNEIRFRLGSFDEMRRVT